MVKIYTSPTCAFCEMAKEFLKEKGIPFEEHDISQDEALQKEMFEKSGQFGLPIIDINGVFLNGFNRVKLEEELERQKSALKSKTAKAKTKAKKK